MGAMAPPLFENMLIGTHTFLENKMNFRECGCQFTDSLGKSVDWHPHSQNSGQGPVLDVLAHTVNSGSEMQRQNMSLEKLCWSTLTARVYSGLDTFLQTFD